MKVTEASNPITYDIDTQTPEQAVRLLRQSEAQLFSGFSNHASISDLFSRPESCEWVVDAVARAIDRPSESRVIVSGAGASGMLAVFLARSFNAVLHSQGCPPCFDYLIAGGDNAILRVEDSTEDDPLSAVTDLEAAAEGFDHVVFVGVSCGLSATYVGAQLEYAMQRAPRFTSVLLGFNEVHSVQPTQIEGWGSTFQGVLTEFAALSGPNHILLNPIVGPESIAGSTRMKCGSATKLVLEVLFGVACHRSSLSVPLSTSQGVLLGHELPETLQDILLCYQESASRAYRQAGSIGGLARMAGAALQRGDSVLYLGGAPEGLLGCFDAAGTVELI